MTATIRGGGSEWGRGDRVSSKRWTSIRHFIEVDRCGLAWPGPWPDTRCGLWRVAQFAPPMAKQTKQTQTQTQNPNTSPTAGPEGRRRGVGTCAANGFLYLCERCEGNIYKWSCNRKLFVCSAASSTAPVRAHAPLPLLPASLTATINWATIVQIVKAETLPGIVQRFNGSSSARLGVQRAGWRLTRWRIRCREE